LALKNACDGVSVRAVASGGVCADAAPRLRVVDVHFFLDVALRGAHGSGGVSWRLYLGAGAVK
jgi:hypothetical protein